MRGKASERTKIRVLGTSMIIMAAFNVLLWHMILTSGLGGVTLPDIARQAAEVQATVAADDPVDEPVGVPVRIRIPSIAVDAAIEKVALAADGSMDVPKHHLDTAWYELGPRPGETGSAAIAGHVDWTHGVTAVFADLHKVKSGDTISVQDDQGAVRSFVVRETKIYDAKADATEVFSSNDGEAHLSVITCEGEWDKQAKQYSKRLVVFADRK